MPKSNDADRSVYFGRDIHQMNLVLGKFLQKSGAEAAMLVDEAERLDDAEAEKLVATAKERGLANA